MSALQILISSCLREDLPPQELCNAIRAARRRAALWDLKGGMLFDGENFLQLWTSADDSVRAALTALRGDAAHRHVHTVQAVAAAPERAWRDFRVGYTSTEALQAVLALPRSEEPIGSFLQLLDGADAH